MSGHSKWSTIKRKKGAADAKRSKIFSKIVKEIMVAAKMGGADIESNPRLRLAVANAKGQNMPKDNIQRAINKATSDNANYQETTFEGYAPGGVAVFVECLSDNNNRTVGNIRAIFNKRNGSLGTNGSLSFLFERKGEFEIKKEGIEIDMDELELEMIDAGAEDIEDEEEIIIITCAMEDFGSVQKKLDQMNIEAEKSGLVRVPNNTQKVDIETAKVVLKMIEAFEEDDDVQNVYHNLEMTDELMEAIENE